MPIPYVCSHWPHRSIHCGPQDPDLWTLGRFMRRAGTDHATIASIFSRARARCPMVGSENGKGQELPGREVATVRTGLWPGIWSLCRHVWPSLRTGARRAYLVLA